MPHWPDPIQSILNLSPVPSSSLDLGHHQSFVLLVADPAATCPARGESRPTYNPSLLLKLLPKSARRYWKKHWDRIQRQAWVWITLHWRLCTLAKGFPSRGGNALCYGFPSSVTVIYLCIRRQECTTKTGYSLLHPEKTPLHPQVPSPDSTGVLRARHSVDGAFLRRCCSHYALWAPFTLQTVVLPVCR